MRKNFDKVAEQLAQNEILFLTAVLVKEFGPRQHWPTRQLDMELPEYLELMTNLELMKRINGEAQNGPSEPTDEFARKLQPRSSGKWDHLPETDVSRKVKAARASRYANREKMLNNRRR